MRTGVVLTRRELARTQPAAYLLDRAMFLNDLAIHLAEQGDVAVRACLRLSKQQIEIADKWVAARKPQPTLKRN
jgi:hypothetical protein